MKLLKDIQKTFTRGGNQPPLQQKENGNIFWKKLFLKKNFYPEVGDVTLGQPLVDVSGCHMLWVSPQWVGCHDR
jgi:hypothetical protein